MENKNNHNQIQGMTGSIANNTFSVDSVGSLSFLSPIGHGYLSNYEMDGFTKRWAFSRAGQCRSSPSKAHLTSSQSAVV